MTHRHPRRRTGAIALASVLVAGLAGPWPAASASPDPKVRLIRPGKAPRRALRYQVAQNGREKLVLSTTMGMKTSAAGKAGPEQTLPTTRIEVDLRVAGKPAADRVKYEFLITDARADNREGVPPAFYQMVNSQIQQIKGASGSAVVDSRGANSQFAISLPPQANPRLSEMAANAEQELGQVSIRLPEEAVGPGARWELRQRLNQNGIDLVQVTTIDLVGVRGDVVTVKLHMRQQAKPQQFSAPGMGGMTAELLSLKAHGAGTATVDLGKLVPNRSSVTVKSDMEMKLMGQIMRLQLDVQRELRRR